MRVIVSSDVDRQAARWLLSKWDAIRVLGLATGSTPEGLYGWLVQYFYDGQLSFREKTTFNLDEYHGLRPNHPQSYRATMFRLLFQYVDLPPDRFHVPPALTENVDAACAAYEDRIRAAGGVDLWILGIGVDGHIAFNEPGSKRDSRTRKVALHPSTIEKNARFFEGDAEEVPREALTVGIGTILDGREILLLAKGESKAGIIREAVLGEETERVPASFLQGHPNCTFLLDPAAASELRNPYEEATTELRSAAGKTHTLEVLD